jgi:hypothetical protein
MGVYDIEKLTTIELEKGVLKASRLFADRNGSIHTYSYAVLGRFTTDAITTLGSGVDGAVRAKGAR